MSAYTGSDISNIESVFYREFKSKIITPLNIKVEIANTDFTPPIDETWIRLTVNYADSDKLARGFYERVGIATAQVFSPIGSGTKDHLSVCTSIQKAFQDYEYIGKVLVINSVNILNIGTNGGTWQSNVDINFTMTEEN